MERQNPKLTTKSENSFEPSTSKVYSNSTFTYGDLLSSLKDDGKSPKNKDYKLCIINWIKNMVLHIMKLKKIFQLKFCINLLITIEVKAKI